MALNEHPTAKQPREIANCVSACLRKRDIDGIVAMFHHDCLVFFPPDAPPNVGHAGVRKAFEALLDTPPVIRSEVISEVIVGDFALLCANWSMVAPDGSVLAEGQSTEVAKKFDHGGWGYLIDCPYGPPPFLR